MAKIIILREGTRKAFEVNNVQLEEISKQVDEARKSGKVRIIKLMNPKIEFMTSDYRGSEYDAPDKGEDPMKTRAKEWHEKRRKFANKTAEEKTEHFMKNGFVMFKSVVPELKDDQVKTIEERTLQFFKGNPRRCYPNGDVFLFKYDKRMIDIWDMAKMRILENIILEDRVSVKSDEQYEMKVMGIQEEMVMKNKPVHSEEAKAAVDPMIPKVEDDDKIQQEELDKMF